MAQEKSELEKELADIRKEVIESRNLVIKTDNLLKNLHAELKMVGKRQEDFQKRQWLSSAVAYAAFVVLSVGGGLAISSARTAGAAADRDRLEKQAADLAAQIDRQKAETASQQAAERSAAEVYQMMTSLPGDERLKGVDLLVKLDASRLSPLARQALNDKAAQLRREIGQAAFERGKAAFRRNEMGTVVTELTRFLAMNPDPQDQLDASFFLGVAYHQMRKHEQAVPLLQRFVTEDRKSRSRDYAMLLLALSYQETSQLEKAADTARDALGTYPNSEFTPQLRGRLATVKRLQSDAGIEAPAPVAPAPAIPAPPAAGVPSPEKPKTPAP
jgi:tetratricopeptide (TPR) repeat protein